MQGRVFLGWTSAKLGLMCHAQGHNAVTPLRLEPAAPCSRVKHPTRENIFSYTLHCYGYHILLLFVDWFKDFTSFQQTEILADQKNLHTLILKVKVRKTDFMKTQKIPFFTI